MARSWAVPGLFIPFDPQDNTQPPPPPPQIQDTPSSLVATNTTADRKTTFMLEKLVVRLKAIDTAINTYRIVSRVFPVLV